MSWEARFLALKKSAMSREERMAMGMLLPGEGRGPYSPEELEDPEDELLLLQDGDTGIIGSQPTDSGVSSVVVRESGAIEIFAGANAGIRVDPQGTITLIGSRINLLAGEAHIKTAPQGLRWNDIHAAQKSQLLGVTAAGMPVTVQPHSPEDLKDGHIATGILVAAKKLRGIEGIQRLWRWLAR